MPKDWVAVDIEAAAFFAADHAVVENGKVYVNGGFWSMLRFPSYPAVQPTLSIVAVIHVPWRAYQQDHRFSIGLQDSDGKDLPLNIAGEFRVGAGVDMRVGDPTLMPLAVSINNFTIETAGDYAFTLSVDGTEISRYQVRAIQVAVPSPQPSAPPPPAE